MKKEIGIYKRKSLSKAELIKIMRRTIKHRNKEIKDGFYETKNGDNDFMLGVVSCTKNLIPLVKKLQGVK